MQSMDFTIWPDFAFAPPHLFGDTGGNQTLIFIGVFQCVFNNCLQYFQIKHLQGYSNRSDFT